MQIGNLKTGSRSLCSRLEEGGELKKGVSAGGKKKKTQKQQQTLLNQLLGRSFQQF